MFVEEGFSFLAVSKLFVQGELLVFVFEHRYEGDFVSLGRLVLGAQTNVVDFLSVSLYLIRYYFFRLILFFQRRHLFLVLDFLVIRPDFLKPLLVSYNKLQLFVLVLLSKLLSLLKLLVYLVFLVLVLVVFLVRQKTVQI